MVKLFLRSILTEFQIKIYCKSKKKSGSFKNIKTSKKKLKTIKKIINNKITYYL